MANDNKKTKNNAPCEERQETRELTEEDLEQVSGGQNVPHDVFSLPGIMSPGEHALGSDALSTPGDVGYHE